MQKSKVEVRWKPSLVYKSFATDLSGAMFSPKGSYYFSS